MVIKTVLAGAFLLTAILALTPIGLDPIKPYQLSKGKLTTYQFSYIPASAVLSDAVLRITFPSEFDYAVIASNLSCMSRTDNTSWSTVPCTFTSKQVVLTLGTIRIQNNYAVISTPQNPSTYNMSSFFTVCVGYNDVVVDCNEQFSKVIFSEPPVEDFMSPTVTSLTSVVVGQGGTYQFGFGLSKGYAAGNSIRVTFPRGFSTKNPICQMNGTYNQIIETVVLPNSRSVQCRLINKTLSSNQILKIIGMTNPLYSGVFGNSLTTQSFKIQLLSGNTNIIFEDLTSTQTITILPGTISASLVAENYFIKSTATYSFYINLLNSLNSSNYIRLRFPASWTLYNNNCTPVTGFVLKEVGALQCTNLTEAGNSDLRVWGFESASSTAQLLLQVKLTTPSSDTTYPIEISTWNEMGSMDSTSLSVTLNSTYGTINMLSINAITASAKLPAGKTGPLQMTFFLNYQLPQTNVLTSGYISVKIYPQISTPNPSTNGVIKCYFFNTIPAQSCTWVPSGSFTLLTIYTPLNSFYQYSEIPVTITTEGATSADKIGITIDTLVQRYRFEIAFYKMTSTVIPTEVYYTEFIADAIKISTVNTITAQSLVSEVNQWTQVQVVMNSPLSFTDGSKNFRFKVEFLSGGGWATGLGYEPETLYKNFPCVMYNSNGNAVGNPIRCDLYTYTTGPYASLTATNPGPYILFYGFRPQIYSGQSFRFQVPRILIGSATNIQTSIRFSILEQTPAMLDPFIELYYEQFLLFTTTSQSFVTPTAITMTSSGSILSNTSINAQSSYTFTWSPGVASTTSIIHEFDKDSVPSFTNQMATCSSNLCTLTGYPANWLTDYRTFPTPVTQTLAANIIWNGRYAGSFTFYARAMKAGRVVAKVSYTVVYTALQMTWYSFYMASGQSLAYIFKGSQHYYTIAFRPITSTPSNGFLRFIFGGNIAPAPIPYCLTSSLTGYTAIGVQCTVQSPTTLKIYNINGLTAGSNYYVDVGLVFTESSTASATPSVTVNTYYTSSVSSSVVDTITMNHWDSPISNQFNSPTGFTMKSPRTVLDLQRVNYVGKFQVAFVPYSASGASATVSIVLALHPHPWNGGFWKTPNAISTDPLVCYVNLNRVPCSYTYTSQTLTVTMLTSSVALSQSSDNLLTLDTQYLAPNNGLVYPSQGGYYRTDITLLNSANTVLETGTFHTRVLPQTLQNLYVTSACNDINQENMWMVDFNARATSLPYSGTNATTYSRIRVEFPTVDTMGNAVFRGDLGGYAETGDMVGCSFVIGAGYVDPASGSVPMVCRLIKSETIGEPARVEVLYHDNFSPDSRMRFYIAKVFNPTIATPSVNISITIDHVVAASNLVYQLYHDTFTVFMNTQVSSPASDISQNSGLDYFQNSLDVGDTGTITLNLQTPNPINVAIGYYSVAQLPPQFKVLNTQTNSTAVFTCDSTYHLLCLTFPQINYIVIQSKSNLSSFSPRVVFPTSISQVATSYNSLIWQGGVYAGKVVTTLTSGRWQEIRGGVTWNSAYAETSGAVAFYGKREFQINVDFTVANPIPVGGSIEVRFPSGIMAYPNCRSALHRGSLLYSKAGAYAGEVACTAQSASGLWSWVITGFSAVSASTRIIIFGKVDLPSSTGNPGYGQIITYSDTHSTNIRNNGKIIDYVNPNWFPFSISIYGSLNINTEVMMIETLPLRTGYVGPLQFKFRLAVGFTAQDVSRLQVRMPQTSIIGQAGGFGFDVRKKVCEIVKTTDNQRLGCMVTSVVNDTTPNFNSILYTITTSTSLLANTLYQLKITTQSGTPNSEGLAFPTSAGKYRIDVNFDADGSRSYSIHDHLYLQVHGPRFKNLVVTSFVTLPNEWNLIWVQVEPTTTIALTHQLVVEIPTKAINGQLLFSNDLGTGLADNSWFRTDVIAGFTNSFMVCRFFNGDQANGKNAKIVCGSFSNTVAAGTSFTFAFKVKNPSISSTSQLAIPVIVYTQDTGLLQKTNYMLVENGIFVRNSNDVAGSSDGNVRSVNYLLNSADSLWMTTRNPSTLVSGDAYVMFFGFPVRRLGKYASACTVNSTGTVIGDAYYHYHNWVVICVMTTSVGSGTGMRLGSFYTPWYYLSSSELSMYTISRYFSSASSLKVVMNDFYKNQNPRNTPTTATVTLTPVMQTTKYNQMRDDYVIAVTAGTDTGNEVGFAQKIGIYFHSGYNLYNSECVEGANSVIKVEHCYIDTVNEVLWVTPVVDAAYKNNDRLEVVTRGLAVQNPATATINMNGFTVKYYAWQNISEPASLIGDTYCYMSINPPSQTISFSILAGSSLTSFTPYQYTWLPQQRYYKQTPFSPLLHRAPFEFQFKTPALFNGISSGYHSLTVQYPSSYSAVNATNINDLTIYKPVCYLNNNRVKRCVLDTTGRTVRMEFQFGLAASTVYYASVSILDPRNPDNYGFLYTPNPIVSITCLKVYLQASGGTNYYAQTDPFPAYYLLPSGANAGPFRGIVSGSIAYGSRIASVLNPIHMTLGFNRTDVTGLLFQILLVDQLNTQLYSNAALTAAFFGLSDGSPYPCNNFGLSAGGSAKCFLVNGDNLNKGVPARIFMTDFTYVNNMNCRVLFRNPDLVDAWVSIKVLAYGGTRSSTNLYGNVYMGYWNFMHVFKIVASAAPYATTYTPSAPTKTCWQDSTTHTISGNGNAYLNSISLLQVRAYDSSFSVPDKTVCIASRTSPLDYQDLLWLNTSTTSTAYFFRTWQGTSGISWPVGSLKCKHYKFPFKVYHYTSDTSYQASNIDYTSTSFTAQYATSTNVPVIRYLDFSERLNTSSTKTVTMEIDLTSSVEELGSFRRVSGDSYVMKLTWTNKAWTTVSACRVVGGLGNSEGRPVECTVGSDTLFTLSNFDGFEANPLVTASTKYRLRLQLTFSQIANANPNVLIDFYANADANTNNLQRVFSKTSAAYDATYPNHGASTNPNGDNAILGSFQIQQLSNTNMRVLFSPSADLAFGASNYLQKFRVQFNRFMFGTSCNISNVVLELTSSTNPGTGVNNTLVPTTACTTTSIEVNFASNTWASIFSGQTDFNTTQYVILYLTIAGSGQDFPVENLDWAPVLGLYYYQSAGTWNTRTLDTATFNTANRPSLASTATISTTATNRNSPVEFSFYLGNLATSIGTSNTNKILLLDFVGSSAWADPFTYTDPTNNVAQVECLCFSGVGPLTLSSTTPFTSQKCYRRLGGITGAPNTFSITVDVEVLASQDVTCYFPEWMVTTGMYLQPEFKVIYGSSFPNYVVGSGPYGGYFKSLVSNPLDFTASTPDSTTTYISNTGTPSQSTPLYATAQTVQSTLAITYSLTFTLSSSINKPLVYLFLGSAGPIASSSFCLDANTFSECRAYSTLTNVIVFKLKSNSVTTFSLTKSGVSYPTAQDFTSSRYNLVAYTVGASGSYVFKSTLARSKANLKPLTPTLTVVNDLYGSNKVGYETTLLITFGLGTQTLYRYDQTGSKVTITFDASITTFGTTCLVSTQYDVNQLLSCSLSSSTLTITSPTSDYLPLGTITLTLGITNPSSNPSFSLLYYSRYQSSTRNWLVSSVTATYTVDASETATRLSKSMVYMYPIRSRISTVANSPLRFQFRFPAGLTTNVATTGQQHLLTYSQVAVSSSFECYFVQYDSLDGMEQQTQNVYLYAPCSKSSGSTLTISTPRITPMTDSKYYQLVVMPIGISGCTAGTCATQSGFMQPTNFDPVTFISSPSTNTFSSGHIQNLYLYQGQFSIVLSSIYLLSTQALVTTSLHLTFILNFTNPSVYPNHYLDIILWDVDFGAFIGFEVGDELMCQLGGMFVQVAGRTAPRCTLTYQDSKNNVIKVRISHFGAVTSGVHTVSIDDFKLPGLAGYPEKSRKFDVSISYYNPSTNTRYENFFRELFVIDGTNTTASIAPTISFSSPSSTFFGVASSATVSGINWPFDSSTGLGSLISSKMAMQFTAGYSATWSSISNLNVADNSNNNFIILWTNSRLNKLILGLTSRGNGVATTLTLTGLTNPYPYQRPTFDNSQLFTLSFFYNYYLNTLSSVAQPAWSVYQVVTNPLVYINQNLPSNTLDSHVSGGVINKVANGALSVLLLSVEFTESDVNVRKRELDNLEVTFTAGVSFVKECMVIRNNSQYVNPLTTCQAVFSTNWKIEIYGVTESMFDVGWSIRAVVKLNTGSLAYTYSLFAKSGVAEYIKAYSPTITASYYSASRTIPTLIGWTNKKYIEDYFEHQVKYLEAVTGQSTSRLKIRFRTWRTISSTMTISLTNNVATSPFNPKNSNSAMLCQFLPVMASNYQQYSVGYYSQCSKNTGSNPYSYTISAPYSSLPSGSQFLLQIQQSNVITSSFYTPTTSARSTLVFDHSGQSQHFSIDSYPLFRQVEILHTTTTVNDYDTLTVKYTPYGAASGAASSDLVLRLDAGAELYPSDAGVAAMWSADGYGVFWTGDVYSHWLSNANASANTVVKFGQYGFKYTPLTFALTLQSAYVDNTAYIWRIPMVKNPSQTFAALRYNLTLLSYTNGASASHPKLISFAQIINQYYTVTNTSSTLSATILSTSNSIQSNSVSLQISLGMYSIPQWNVATWKLDNSLVGLVSLPDFVSPNDTNNYFYYYFPKVNMVMAEKKSGTSVTSIGIGGTQGSQEYATTYGFNFIKIFSTSNGQLLTNPFTQYSMVPSALTLTYFTTYSSNSVTLVQGLQNQGSNSLYLLRFTVQRIPQGGQINLVLNPSFFSFPTGTVGRQCFVESGFVRSTKSPLRCFQSSTSPYAYVVRGFSSVAASTQLGVYVYMRNTAAVSNTAFTVNVFGVEGLYTSYVSSASIGSQTFSSSNAPSTIYTVPRYYLPYLSKTHSDYYFTLQGTFTLKVTSLTGPSHSILFHNPLASSGGNIRFLYKQNSSTVPYWYEPVPTYISTGIYSFAIPVTTNLNYHINTTTEYLFRVTTHYSSPWNGYMAKMVGAVWMFWFQTKLAGVTQELGYYEVNAKPSPFQFTLGNKYTAAGKQTMLTLTFTVDVDAVPGDEISVTFSSNSLLYNMFPNDVEGVDNTLGYKYLDCRQVGSNNYISSSRMTCLLYYGNNAISPPTPARLSIILSNYISGWTTSDTVSFMIANVQNPSTVGMAAGAELTILKTCRNAENEKCAIAYYRGYYYTTAVAETVVANSPTFTPSNNEVLRTGVSHSFGLQLTSPVTTSDIIYILYPENYDNVMPSSCGISGGHTCYVFPTRNWVTIIPASTLSGSITLTLTNMNNGQYLQPSSLYLKVTISRGGTTADIYNILHNPHTTLQRSPSSGSASSMTLTPTQTPNIFLRNYANTVTFTLTRIYTSAFIRAFYIIPPADVTSWEVDYCNATLSVPNAERQPYPMRFSCGVWNETMIRVLVTSDFDTFVTSWHDYNILVNVKFTLIDFPTPPILYQSTPITSGTFNAYGSKSASTSSSNFYISQCSSTIPISQHQVPIISHVTFNTKSFYERGATVSTPEIFYLLLKPTSSELVHRIVFSIPREFSYPGVSNHDNCKMIGRSELGLASCQQTRQNGQTQITIYPTPYDNSVKIIQLGSEDVANWFTAPALPGSFYNMTVEMYSASGGLLEKQTVNISAVLGSKLDIAQMTLKNSVEALKPGIVDVGFKIGTTQVPPGYNGTATMSSEIQLIFENVKGFANDLGTGLKTGDELGCVFKTGLTLGNDRLKCFLYVGTSVTDKPKVRIINYALIQPSTSITISVSNIVMLAAGSSNINTISVGIVIYYTSISASSYLYLPTPQVTTATYAPSVGSMNQFTAAFAGNNVVLLSTEINLVIRPRSTMSPVPGHYYVLQFEPSTLIDPYNTQVIACSTAFGTGCDTATIEVFYGSGMIRWTSSGTQSSSTAYFVNFTGVPTSAYTLQNRSITLTLNAYTGYQRDATSTATLTRIVQKCTLINFGVISVSSLNGGQIGVTYVFSFQTNHKVPPDAAVSITIPIDYGDMRSNGVTCSISIPTAQCQINTPSRAEIYLNGTVLDPNTAYTITLVGLQNPNIDVSALQFVVTTYFNSNIYLGYKICENAISVPAITVKAIRTCGFSVTADYYNTGYNASYTFLISCTDVIRFNSKLYISLPSSYSVSNPTGNLSCWSYESTTLVRPTCTLSYINGSFMLSTDLLSSSSQISLTLVTNLVNPANNTYYISGQFLSQGNLYARTSPDAGFQLTVFNNEFLEGVRTNVYLTNIPRGAGVSSTYVFKVAPVGGMAMPDALSISFPSNFNSQLGSNIKVGIVTSSDANLFSKLNTLGIDQLLANKSSTIPLYSLPSFTINSNLKVLTISNLNSLLSTNSTNWIYYLIKGVQNPAQYVQQDFRLVYSEGQTTSKIADWLFTGPLVYYISPPPNFLSIVNKSASDYDLLFPAVYSFTIQSGSGVRIATAGQQLSIIITIPAFYNDTLWANTNLTCTLSGQPSTCSRYDDQIAILKNFTSNQTSLPMSISSILNPSSPTFCNTTDVNLLVNTYFRIKIMDLTSNDILFETSAIVDSSTCMTFSVIRIPIVVQYPLKMSAGLVYNITFTITKPAINLKVVPFCSSVGVSFLPATVSFNSYSLLQQNTEIFLRSDMAAGTYTVNFTKTESSTQTFFRNILPVEITVVKFDNSSNQSPTIAVQAMVASTVGYPVVVPVVLSTPASIQMVLTITVDEQQNRTSLAQYSHSFGNFTISPRVIIIPANSRSVNFTISYYNTTVPPGLTLRFSLTSLYPIIHILTTPMMYLLFSRDPKYQVLSPPLRMSITTANTSTSFDIGKSVVNIFVRNTTNLTNIQPIILSINRTAIGSTFVNFDVFTRDTYSLYYAVMKNGYPEPQTVQDFVEFRVENATLMGEAVSVVNASNLVNYKASIALSGLESSTIYNIFVVAKSLLGASRISKSTFTTTLLSFGTVMKLSMKDIIDPLTIVSALQQIFRIKPNRIKVLTSNQDLQRIKNSINTQRNTLNYPYQVVIVPDPTNDNPTPIQIAASLAKNATNLGLLASYLPLWDNTTSIPYYQIRATKPIIHQLPTAKRINFYNATFTMSFWQKANAYAVLIQKINASPHTLNITNTLTPAIRVGSLPATLRHLAPSSKQIRDGVDPSNSKLNTYRYTTAVADSFGQTTIFFDDLKPGSMYDMYITASSILPYEPTMLYSDEEVLKVSFETLYNPNLNLVSSTLTELKVMNPELGKAIEMHIRKNKNKNMLNKKE